MSVIQPRGIPITIGGKERRFLFTLSVVDEIQSEFAMPISQVIEKLADETEVIETAAKISLYLMNDDIERENRRNAGSDPLWTEKDFKDEVDITMIDDLVRVILQAYGYSVPDPEEDEVPNPERSRSS